MAVAGLVFSLATIGCGGGGDSTPAQAGSGGSGGDGGTGGGGSGGSGGATPEEICDNGIDDDGDERIDCLDVECAGEPACGLCGNGVLDEGEACDGDALGGKTCATVGFDHGVLECDDECELDTSGCVYPDEVCDNEVDDDRDGDVDCEDDDCAATPYCLCGNGVIDGLEACDGDDLADATCITLGYGAGELGCAEDCAYDVSGCRYVEDCATEGDEDHDGSADCLDEDCNTAPGCNVCGDGRADLLEVCDGADLVGQTCESLGFLGGTLVCSACALDTSSCLEPEACTGGADEDADGAIDCADTDCAADANCVPGAFCHTAFVATGDDSRSTAGAGTRFSGSCPTAGPEHVYVYTPGTAGQVGNLHVSLTSSFNLSVHVRTVCDEPASELACEDESPGGVEETLDLKVDGGVPVYLVVDAASPLGGADYRLQVSFDPCGNGTATGYEQCDPPNGGTCSQNCLLAETSCGNLLDDDEDGLFDCQDASRCGGVDPLCVPGTGLVGTACTVSSSCASAAGADPICWSEALAGFPSGMCSEACSLTANDCPANAACLDVGRGNATGACYRTCASVADCPSAGYKCAVPAGGSTAVCLPGCTADAQCPVTNHCDVARGLCTVPEDCDNLADDDHDGKVDCTDADCAGDLACIPPELDCSNLIDDDGDGQMDCRDTTRCRGVGNICTPGGGAIGSACTASNQCASAAGADPACIDGWMSGFRSGYCSELCDLGGNDCPTGSTCVSRNVPLRQSLPATTVGVCMETCTTAADCGTGWTCTSPSPGAPNLCWPVEDCANTFDDDMDGAADCADTECAALPACNASGTCGVVPVAGPVNTGTTVGAGDDWDTADLYYCQMGDAPEVIYRYSPNQPGTTGALTITLSTTTADLGFYVRTTCDDASTELGCLDGESAGTDEVGVLTMGGGEEIFIFIDGYDTGEAGDYTLTLSYTPYVCGNGTVEPGEVCDDGNTTSGDGCSATCQPDGVTETEPNETFGSADVWMTPWKAVLPAYDDVDYLQFTVPGPSSTVTVETTDTTGWSCAAGDIDTVVTIYGTNGTTWLAEDDDIDLNNGNYCSSAVVTGLAAGTYYAEIIPYYEIDPYTGQLWWDGPYVYGVSVTIQ